MRVLGCVYMRVHPGDDMGGSRQCAFGMLPELCIGWRWYLLFPKGREL